MVKKSTETDMDALKLLLSRGNISVNDVLDNIKYMKNQKILNSHLEHYKIWQGKDGRFRSYVPDGSNIYGRKLLIKSTMENLENAIIGFYKEHEKRDPFCLEKLYPDWINYKSLHTDSQAYIRRINNDWVKYYKDTELVQKPLDTLTYIYLDTWAHEMVKKHGLTKKQFFNMAVILRQSLIYAADCGYISESPFERVHINPKLFQKAKKKADKTQVFLTDEQPKIIDAAFRDFMEKDCSHALAIPLLFLLGLRAGELVALKFSDIDEEKNGYIHIQRMEIRIDEPDADGNWHTARYEVAEHAKTKAGDRNLYLPAKAREILSMLKIWNLEHGYTDTGYIFMGKKGRLHEHSISYRLRLYCRQCGIPERSQHKIRKTYISTLIDSGTININYIRQQVGHEDERTTYGNYCFNRKTEAENHADMEDALSRIM